MNGGGLLVALAIALLLGLRHATDPDHLTAVSTLVMSEDEPGTRKAARLGAAWGLGHALTLLALGLPVVVLGSRLPDWIQHGLELAVGVLIVGLAVRLLLRRRHPPERLGRSPRMAFGIGLVHGAGGSAGVGVLLVAAMPGAAGATAALAVLALGTAISMTAVTALFGRALAGGPLPRRFEPAAPVLGTFSLLFGLWYGLAALNALPYVFKESPALGTASLPAVTKRPQTLRDVLLDRASTDPTRLAYDDELGRI